MKQLLMYWLSGTPVNHFELPEGYSFSNYKTTEDKMEWVECCLNGLTNPGDDDSTFDRRILGEDLDPYKDVFFLDYYGKHIGTTTAFVHPEENTGDLHMVGIRTEYRGKGLAKYLTEISIDHLSKQNVNSIHLTTDDERLGAVKSYLSAGFLPVNYDPEMDGRWAAVLENLKIDSVKMLKKDGTFDKILYRSGWTGNTK